MAELVRTSAGFDHDARVRRAKKALKRSRKDSADKWVKIYENFDPMTGVRQKLWYNVETEEINGQRTDEYMPQILDANKDQYVETMNRTGKVPDLQKVATIPMGVFMENFQAPLMEQDHSYVKKLLNDPDNKALRTWKGRL